jgi:hypothetical protein
MPPLRLVTLAPGHFHAALLQKRMLPELDPHVHIYSPLDDDLLAHLGRIAGFNRRAEEPTRWTLDVCAGGDWLDRFDAERPGDVVIIAGRNRRKIELIERAVAAGKHVLADKPWIIVPEDLPRVAAVLEAAARGGLVLSDVMTERHEITSILQRDIVRDRELFGEIERGTSEWPGISMRSIHRLKKLVAGAPLRRPGWFFDIAEQGEALADVGTHLVDLIAWMIAPDQSIDTIRDIRIVDADRFDVAVERSRLAEITGLADFPRNIEEQILGDTLWYSCNSWVSYELCGIRVCLDVEWHIDSPYDAASKMTGDMHSTRIRGTRSSADILQTAGSPPDLFVSTDAMPELERRVSSWQERYPGVAIERGDGRHRIVIPEVHRTGHEAHFAAVAAGFARDVAARRTFTPIEASNMLAKYYVTTNGVALARAAKSTDTD